MAMHKIGNVLVTIGKNADGKKIKTRVGTQFGMAGSDATFIRLSCMPFPKIGRSGYPELWLTIEPDAPTDTGGEEAPS